MRSLNSSFTAWRLLILIILSTACGLLPKDPPPEHAIRFTRVDLQANADANGGEPLSVDLVFVQDRDLLATLQTQSAAMWRTYKRENPDVVQEQAHIYALDMAPGQELSVSDFPDAAQTAQALVIFAHYANEGLHRKIVQYQHQAHIRLQATDFVVLTE